MSPTSEERLWHPDDTAPRLPVYVRFVDLKANGIVGNWSILQRLIDEHGFPPGIMIAKNTRAWPLDAVMLWLEARPVAKKIVKTTSKHISKTRKAK